MVPPKISSILESSICPCPMTKRKRCVRCVLIAVMPPNGKKGKTVNNGTKRNKAVIVALAARLDALCSTLLVEKDNEGQGTAEGTGNRNNGAL
jgi:hypothetical protein